MPGQKRGASERERVYSAHSLLKDQIGLSRALETIKDRRPLPGAASLSTLTMAAGAQRGAFV